MTNQRIRVTKCFTFDMAHALYGYDGPCKNIHGHTYHLNVSLLGEVITDSENPKQGMVIDFTDFKHIIKTKIVDVFDHALVLNANSPHAKIEGLQNNFSKIIYTNFQPTCENLLIDFLNRVKTEFPTNLQIHSIRLNETPTSYAEWFAADN